MKKRIGVVMYQTSTSKGQELVAQRMVRYFRKIGHEAYLIASVYHDGKEIIGEESLGQREYILTNDSELQIPIIRVGSFTSRWPPRRILFKDSIHTLERIVNEFRLNVLITHSTLWNGPEEVAKFVEWRRNIKKLGGYTDPLVFCHMSHFQEPSPHRYSLVERSFRIAWNRMSLRTILNVANMILVVTPEEKEEKVKMGALPDKCVLFPGGVDDIAFVGFSTSDPREFFERLRSSMDAKIVTYLGTIEERKNPKAVLDVAENLLERKEIHFVIAGRGDTEYADNLRNRAANLSNVTYLGEITEKEKVQLMSISYLNILLSRMEALGLTQLEFMFKGVPVITSAVGGQAWIVRDQQEGIHVDGYKDVDGTVQAIQELVDDKTKWERMSEKARERSKEFTLTGLIATLDAAITRELEIETDLSKLPKEVRETLSEPEVIIRSWSHGNQKIAATNRRIFIQQGNRSRNTIETTYSNIKSIQFIRQCDWGSVLIGSALSLLMFTQHYIVPIVSGSITALVPLLITDLSPNIDPSHLLASIWVAPIILGLSIFIIRARNGYALHAGTENPIYLSHSFRDAIEFIREVQDYGPPRNAPTLDEAEV